MTTKAPPGIDPRLAHLYDENGVFYPSEDGIPMPDAEYQGIIFRTVVTPLYHYIRRNRPNAHVAGNTFVYYEPGNPQRFVSPDCYAVFDVDVDHIFYRNTYRVWEIGKPPDFALEIASDSTAAYDIGEKAALYASIGIGEYWLYDATPDSEYYGVKLAGGHLVGDRYEPFRINEDADGLVWGHSPALGLDLCWDNGKLRFRDPATGEFLPDYGEMYAALQDEAAARQAAAAEAAELREQLRRLQEQQGR